MTPSASPSEPARWDAVVVGAGIAGLVAATDLAHRGHRVLVLEHNHQAGGLMSGIRRHGFYFDAGCQSFEDLGIVFPLLAQYGLDDLATFRRATYRVVMPGLDEVVASLPQMRAAFQRAYPESADGFARAFGLHERTSAFLRDLFVPGRVPFVRDGGPAALARFAARAVAGGVRAPGGVTQRVRDLRTWLWDDFTEWYERTLPPSAARDLLSRSGYTRMNVFVASAFWHLWAHDYWYPEGGLQAFLDRWVERLRARGVAFRFKRTVTALEADGGRVVAVRTARGERLEAGEVVWAADLRQLVHRVAPGALDARAAARVDGAPASDALVSVYLGLDLPPEALRERLRASHVFFFPDAGCRTALDPADPDAHRRAFLEVTGHSAFDPALAPPGRSALVVQAFTRSDWLDGWGTGSDGDVARADPSLPRPAAYRGAKRRVAEDLLGVLEGLLPGVRDRVAFRDVGTPHAAVRFTRNAFGATAGWELAWRAFPFPLPLGAARTRHPNLHLAGQYTAWPGAVPTAALSGKIAALRAHEGLAAGARRRPAQASRAVQEPEAARVAAAR